MSSTTTKVTLFQDLQVWQKSMLLVEMIYKVTKMLPRQEQFSLTDQLRRSAVSIPSNIAEGQRRNNTKEFKQFCAIARGSAAELETQLMIVQKVHNTDTSEEQELSIEIQKMLSGIIKNLHVN